MSAHPFVTGGPVPPDSPVYIERDADDKARRLLRRMEYITLIEPRQQGKTSLIHCLARTMDPGFVFAYANAMRLDKSSEVSWYTSLCRNLLRKVHFIPQTARPSPPHNGSEWGDFMTDLAERAEETGHYMVIALDELGDVWMDWRIGFFSNIRAIFDERPNEPCFQHLTFILAGTYNPRALVSDPRTSPFNVAQRVHLPDFTSTQTGQLVAYLELPAEDAAAVAQRIHCWTDGQPYLTQRLCRTLAEGEAPATPEGVDLAVARLYREDPNHLPRVLEALDPEKHPRLRGYVERVLVGHRPQFRPASESRYHGPLALIGVLKADELGRCKVRNRIYERALQGAVVEMSHEPSFTNLYSALIDCYDLEELRTLCAQLGVPFDDLRGEGRQAKARELILWLERRGRLDELSATLRPASQESDKLRIKVLSGQPQQVSDVGTQLMEMDSKVNALLASQTAIQDNLSELRQAVLARFDASEQAIIATVVDRLDQSQMAITEAVLDAVEAGRVPESELQETLTAVQHALSEIRQQPALFGPTLASEVECLSEVVEAPKLDVKHKLKITAPIIPFILSYEGEVELRSGLNLEVAWQRLVTKVRGER